MKKKTTDFEPAEVKVESASALDALVRGTMDGMQLLLSIIAMIIVLFALVSLFNQFLALFSDLTLQALLGFLFRPIVWLMGGASQ